MRHKTFCEKGEGGYYKGKGYDQTHGLAPRVDKDFRVPPKSL